MMTLDYLQVDAFLLEIFLPRLASQSSITYLFSSVMSTVIVLEGCQNDEALFPAKCFLFPHTRIS